MPTEFELIDDIFLRRARAASTKAMKFAATGTGRPGRAALLGIGDDCALLTPSADQALAVSTDMLVSGRHFLPDVDPVALGHKSLAVNLSDLAAMGARPLAFTLSLALPPALAADAAWLNGFANGLFALADAHDCELVGGDTTAGPLTISITIFGEVPQAQALRRDAAQSGDDIWISGTLGDARLALGLFRADASRQLDPDWPVAQMVAAENAGTGPSAKEIAETLANVRGAMERPTPRVALGIALRGVAHAAIDLSDGLSGDLAHIARRSGLIAQVNADALPRSSCLSRSALAVQAECTMNGGDDYELCFTAPAAARARLTVLSGSPEIGGVALTRVGVMLAPDAVANDASPASVDIGSAPDTSPRERTANSPARRSIAWTDSAGRPIHTASAGFDHFAPDRRSHSNSTP